MMNWFAPKPQKYYRKIVIVSRYRSVLVPYGIVTPQIDDLSQLWDHFHSGFAVVCVVHNYRLAAAAEAVAGGSSNHTLQAKSTGLRAPDLSKVSSCVKWRLGKSSA